MNFSRRQKIGGVLLYLLLVVLRLRELMAESLWFNVGFLLGNAALVIVIVWATGKISAKMR
jgi:hypothetical protein